ncbi:DUF4390 domain-containing protein [uncultured Lamprocystis sp.]|jgi:hypothetical protein|uniref:DUF4390 domain-containing protein n=1 Tax=uncultured Lamprocystis sp. TaxID=543132 RepID=UPI0025F65B90|nr:DUF4390 domain-containing protein [uncultured Lamprocystis sp.]
MRLAGAGGCRRPRWRAPRDRRPGRWWWLILALLLVGSVLAQEFRVTQVHTRLVDGTYTLDATLGFDFSTEALEALANGVPLTILVHLQVRRSDAWIWENSVTDQQVRYAIRHKPLSETYEVYRLPGTSGRTFVTREAAMTALGEIQNLQLVEQRRLTAGENYVVEIKVSLDIEELPLPLRPMAYLRPAWKLASGWTKWPLTP